MPVPAHSPTLTVLPSLRPVARRGALCIAVLSLVLLLTRPLHAQEALNLPTELYVLYNEGFVERYGLGTEGISQITPDSQYIIDFGISPDGNWIAYRNADALIVREVLTENGAALDMAPSFPPLRGEGATIAWSPNADKIAYTTETGLRVLNRAIQPPAFAEANDSAEGQGFGQVLWSPNGTYIAAQSLGGVWQLYLAVDTLTLAAVVPFAADGVWLNDTEFAFAPADGGLLRLDLAQANLQTQILPTSRVYSTLALRPDGELVAFAHNGDGTGTFTRVNPVEARQDVVGETPIDLNGLHWTPGGELALAFRGGALVLVNPVNGSGFALPVTSAVAYGWGAPPLPTVEGMALPANLFFTAADESGIQQVWQLFSDGSPPLPLTQADADVTGYAIAPDGFGVVYSSDRSLWHQTLNNGADPLELAELGGDHNAMPDFNFDGTQVAYVDDGIWTVPVDGSGVPTLLAINSLDESADSRAYTHPRYAPNRAALLVDILYLEGQSTGMLDITSGELLEMPFGTANGRWLYDGRILTFGAGGAFTRAGAQISTLEGLSAPTVLLPDQVSVQDAVLIPRRRDEDLRLIMASVSTGPLPLQVFDFRTVAGLIPVWKGSFVQNPRLSPQGQFIAGYNRVRYGENGELQGQLVLLSLDSGQTVALQAPPMVSLVQWQR